MLRRPVILFKANNLGTGKVFLKPQNISDLSPAPAIDRLVVIADATDIVAALSQQTQPKILGDVRILIFVDQHIVELALIVSEYIGVIEKQRHTVKQKIAEIGGIQDLKSILIDFIQLTDTAVGIIACLCDLVTSSDTTSTVAPPP